MDVGQSDSFYYLQLESGTRRFLCLQQNIGVLVWLLFCKPDPVRFGPSSQATIHPFQVFLGGLQGKSLWEAIKKNILTLIKFLAYKYHFRKAQSFIALPLYGQACVPVHKGYKIFDFRREGVVKIFDSDVDHRVISGEIDQLRIVSRLGFAPMVRRWNVEERWYEEEYFTGPIEAHNVPLDSREFLQRFIRDIIPYATHLMLLQPPLVKNAGHYLLDLERMMEEVWRGTQSVPHRDEVRITAFLNRMYDDLKPKGEVPIYLVFTHGDFCPENMLKSRQGLKVIDWESASFRTALFDVYSYFFYRPFRWKVPLERLAAEIQESLPLLVDHIFPQRPELADSITGAEEMYRHCYYLERIGMLVDRVKTDKNLNVLDCIVRYVEVFEGYEQRMAAQPK